MTATNPGAAATLMVCWAMNEPDNAEHLAELTSAVDAQREAPGVLSVSHGPRISAADWEGPDQSFDYAMVIVFESFESGRAWVPHPIHQKLVGTIFHVGSDIRAFWIST